MIWLIGVLVLIASVAVVVVERNFRKVARNLHRTEKELDAAVSALKRGSLND